MTPLNPEDLLAQAGWVRHLAGRLVVDPGLREDVAQQVMLVALERRPAVLRPAAWLNRLVRNVAWQMNRAERARREYERHALEQEPAAPAEDLVAEAEPQRRIVDAVLALDEPYRTAVLQRFFRGRSAEEIAQREGVPAATVRSWLKRGLDQLRRRFGEEQQLNRSAWLALVLPAAGLKPAAAATAAVLTVGGVVMSVKAVISGLAVIAVIAAAYLLGLPGGEPPGSTVGQPSAVSDASTPGPATPGRPAGEEKPASTGDAHSQQAASVEREVVATSGTVLAGQVLDAATALPVEEFFVQVSHRGGLGEGDGEALGTVVEQSVRAPDGKFRLPLDQRGVYRLAVFSSRHRSERLDDLRLADAAGLTDLVVQLDPGRALSGRVVDDRTGRPVEGAVVGAAPSEQGQSSDLEFLLQGEPERCLHAKTDANGRFLLSGLAEISQRIAAVHPAYAEGWQQLVPSEVESVEIRLRRGATIHGTVFGDDGTPKEGVWIRLHGDEIPLPRTVVSGEGGIYRTPPLRPGTVELYAHPPSGTDQDELGFSSEWLAAEVEDADVQLDFGVSREYATWRGTLYGEDGEPEPGGLILAYLRPPDYIGYKRLKGHRRNVTCDAAGRFEFRKIPPGQYNLIVTLADGTRVGETLAVYLKSPGLAEQDVRLEPSADPGKGGEIHGLVVEDGSGAPVIPAIGDSVSALIHEALVRSFRADLDDQARFHFKNLPPGAYSVYARVGGRWTNHLQLQVREGDVIQDVRLALRPMGSLRLRLLGFRDFHPRKIQYSIDSDAGDSSRDGDGDLAENGSFESDDSLGVGSWRVLVTVEGLGQAERTFLVRSGLVTKIDLRPADLTLFSEEPKTFTVEGTLSWEGGSPIADEGISIYAFQVPGVSESQKSTYLRTNEAGEFSASGMLPGHYWVNASFQAGTMVDFDDLVISLAASDPIPLRLVVPGGTVSGSLYDGRTGRPFDEEGPMWWVFLRNQETQKVAAQIQGGHFGSRFEVKGVASGEYQLLVSARGYEQYVSKPFQYAGPFEEDLGRINLEPCGVFEFEVVDAAGEAIGDCNIYLNDQILPDYRRVPLDGGRFSHVDLPLGEITLAAADGYVTASITVTLEAGKPGKHRFILEKRED
ncbi:MAG: sigma-70 family RNA polymerase sigma factor [Planctomycetota bacterium]